MPSQPTGPSSPMLKRLFVTGLAVVSLAVWTVTVISVSVLRNEGRGGVQTAQAAPASVMPRYGAVSNNNGEQQQHPPAFQGASTATAATPDLAINLPGRNPFEPLAAYFPAAKQKDAPKTAGREIGGPGGKPAADGAATAAETAAREMSFVETLKIRGTLVRGGRTLVIIDDGVYGEGDTIGGRLVVGEIGHKALSSRGRELARQFVVFKGSVREYVVEVKP